MDGMYISKITRLLLDKYNTDFDERKKDLDNIEKKCKENKKDFNKIMKAYITDLIRLNKTELTTLTNLEKPSGNVDKNLLCDYKENKNKLENISFIEDIELLKKIIEYRKYEIKKEIILTKYYFSVYDNIISKILNLKYKYFVIFKNENNDTSSLNVFNYKTGEITKNTYYKIKYEEKLEKLISYKNELEAILENIFIKNKDVLLKKTYCKYVFLQNNLKKFTKNII
jgi:hypothetical protein